jgi:hypothetical protein
MTKEKMKLWTNLKKMRYNKGKETFQGISELYKYKWNEFLKKNLLTKLGFNSINIEINNDYNLPYDSFIDIILQKYNNLKFYWALPSFFLQKSNFMYTDSTIKY